MDVHDISKAILEDKTMTFDDLDLLMLTLATKRRRIAASTQFWVGDRVRLRHIKPKYLEGAEGKVIGQSGQKLKVLLDHQVGRYAQEIRVPRTALEKIR